MSFIPHTQDDIQEMLSVIGIDRIQDLFDEIPPKLLNSRLDNLPLSKNEMEVMRIMTRRANNNNAVSCFLGAGAYEHHIPSAVWNVATRAEYLTSYTPYQPEVSQGNLQIIYEYQTMMANLTGMDVSNASLYDGASALAEAVLMAIRTNKRVNSHAILMPSTVHPIYRRVCQTITKNLDVNFVELPYDNLSGTIDMHKLHAYDSENFSAIVIPQPNFFGVLENVDALTRWAHEKNSLVIALVNPLSLAMLKAPGQWGNKGADIAVGDAQPLGISLASGGPHLGFICCRKVFIHQLPGRIVGRTVDVDGKPGFVVTLRAREQDIRRSKATSNICSNQNLVANAAAIHMSLLGFEGLRRVATVCHENALSLLNQTAKVSAIERVFQGQFFHEFVIKTPLNGNELLDKFERHHILGGFALENEYPELKNCLLVCATETKLPEDLDNYVSVLNGLIHAK